MQKYNKIFQTIALCVKYIFLDIKLNLFNTVDNTDIKYVRNIHFVIREKLGKMGLTHVHGTC